MVPASRSPQLSRRDALRLAAAGGALITAGPLLDPDLAAAQAPAPPSSPIRKPLDPRLLLPRGTNAEMRWSAMAGLGSTTPVDRFFVRNHTATPDVDARTWRLRLFGSGLGPTRSRRAVRAFSLDDLQRLPARSVTCAIECAGNGRSWFGRQQGRAAPGTPWDLGAIGVQRWTGVPLREVLERAGLRADAVAVMPEGLDAPVRAADGTDQGHVRRPIPIAKALDDVLLAYGMDGRELPPDHGFPLRVVVPGWVGVASIKWVGSIEVSSSPLASPWTTTSYRMVGDAYPADAPPLTTQPVKSAFELDDGATFAAGRPVTLTGRSWSGTSCPRSVEVSTDGGRSWRPAKLRGPQTEQAWTRWSLDWTPPAAGDVELLARATDRDGVTQPDAVPFNRDGYQFWAVVRRPVRVPA